MATKKKPTCYVISPIGDEGSETRRRADFLFVEIIKRELDEKYDVLRADKESKPGQIDSQIINEMFDANLVIANLTEQNANVFYELGIRHMTSKATIHMIEKGEIIPFDTSLSRTVKYSIWDPEHLARARTELSKAVTAVESPEFEVDNPVTRARGRHAAQEGPTTSVEKQMLEALDRLESFERRLLSIEDIPSATFKGLGAEAMKARGVFGRNRQLRETILGGAHLVSPLLTDPNLSSSARALFEAEYRAVRNLDYERELREDIREAYEIESAKTHRAEGKKDEDGNLNDILEENGGS